MRNSIKTTFIPAVIATALAATLAAPAWAQGGPRRNGPASGTSTAVQPLTAEETAWVTYMREEEKLARDVYLNLGAQWNLVVFDNIARSEQRHFDAVGRVMVRYGLVDPALNDTVGVFADQSLAELYQQLMAKGAISLKDALEVGVLIEQHDIKDLEEALKVTGKTDLKRVFANLLDGSLSHQEAFESHLELLAALQ